VSGGLGFSGLWLPVDIGLPVSRLSLNVRLFEVSIPILAAADFCHCQKVLFALVEDLFSNRLLRPSEHGLAQAQAFAGYNSPQRRWRPVCSAEGIGAALHLALWHPQSFIELRQFMLRCQYGRPRLRRACAVKRWYRSRHLSTDSVGNLPGWRRISAPTKALWVALNFAAGGRCGFFRCMFPRALPARVSVPGALFALPSRSGPWPCPTGTWSGHGLTTA
jgi:hypothetical protein